MTLRGIIGLLRRWLADACAQALAPSGWRMAAKGLAYLTGVIGLTLAFLTVFVNVQIAEIKNNDDAYQRFVADLSSDKELVRVAAIRRIPDLMGRRVFRSATVAPFPVVLRLLGVGRAYLNAPALREQLRVLLREGTAAGKPLSAKESNAVIAALTKIPPAVWYEDASLKGEPLNAVTWLWDKAYVASHPGVAADTRALFEEALLEGADFSGLDLHGAEFSRLTCTSCIFAKVDLRRAHLKGAILRDVVFEYTILDGADLTAAHIESASFFATSLRGAVLKRAGFDSTTFHEVDMTSPDGPSGEPTDLRGVRFRKVTFTASDLRGANLSLCEFEGTALFRCRLERATLAGAAIDGTVFKSTHLDESDLGGASAVGAVFQGSDISRSHLARANLLNAEFVDTRGIGVNGPADISLADTTNLNIGGVTGLHADAVRVLIQRRAVAIRCASEWSRYQRAGYPFETWLDFRRCGRQP